MRRLRNAKIVATLGPSSQSLDVIERLHATGVDVFRLNFSHGTHEQHQQSVAYIRDVEAKMKTPIGIMLDLQGPKIRVGTFIAGSILLEAGSVFTLDLNPDPGNEQRSYLPHPEVFAALQQGTPLLHDDGKIRLEVLEFGPDYAHTRVIFGGKLSDRKGVNIPGAMLPISALTEKDRADLAFGLNLGVDWVALSFVQRPEDVQEAKNLIQGRAWVLSKLEKPMAIDHLSEIIALSDAIMVARGDLGVELPPEDVPSIQKRIIRSCREAGKPVIIATQMLDSMVNTPSPTRAEASDVATAIYDGVDAVMLSAESASGHFPVEAVEMMNRIICRVEQDPVYRQMLDTARPQPNITVADAITAAAREVTHTIHIAAMVTFTESGSTTLRAARERPEAPIIGMTPNVSTARILTLVWGVHSIQSREINSFREMVEQGCRAAHGQRFASFGDDIIVIAGVPFGEPGATNIIRIAHVEKFIRSDKEDYKLEQGETWKID